MTKQERKELKEKIIAKITQTEQEIIELSELTKPISPENSIGRVSRMDAINNKSVAEAALRSSKQKLNKLHFALTKVDAEDFGNCIYCKNAIQPARLMYLPESTRCVRCAAR